MKPQNFPVIGQFITSWSSYGEAVEVCGEVCGEVVGVCGEACRNHDVSHGQLMNP